MELVREHRLSSIAIPIIYTIKKGYPPDEGAHLALSNYESFHFDFCLNVYILATSNLILAVTMVMIVVILVVT